MRNVLVSLACGVVCAALEAVLRSRLSDRSDSEPSDDVRNASAQPRTSKAAAVMANKLTSAVYSAISSAFVLRTLLASSLWEPSATHGARAALTLLEEQPGGRVCGAPC